MKSFSVIAVAAFAGLVAAQDFTAFGNIPNCAFKCIQNGLGTTGCEMTDIKCICGNTKFITDLSTCVAKECSAEDLKKAAEFSTQFCGNSIDSALVNSATSAVAATATSGAKSNATNTGSPTSSGAGASNTPDAGSAGVMNKPAAVMAGLMVVVGAFAV